MRFAIAVCAALSAALASTATSAETIEGVFNTGATDVEDGPGGTLDVRFHPCKDDLGRTCGTVQAIHDPDPDQTNELMPDGSPIIDFTMIRDLEPKGDGAFRDGKINAVDESLRKGKMVWYGVKVDLLPSGELQLKGCLGFICPRTMYWSPVMPSDSVTAE